jgi:hypothetical protein
MLECGDDPGLSRWVNVTMKTLKCGRGSKRKEFCDDRAEVREMPHCRF